MRLLLRRYYQGIVQMLRISGDLCGDRLFGIYGQEGRTGRIDNLTCSRRNGQSKIAKGCGRNCCPKYLIAHGGTDVSISVGGLPAIYVIPDPEPSPLILNVNKYGFTY